MNKSLDIQREILLINLRAQRLVMAGAAPAVGAGDSTYPRSAVLQFVLRRPQLCLWVLGECVPFILGRVMRRARKRRERKRRRKHNQS